MRGISSPVRVTQEGPDGLSRYCPVRVICLEIQLCFLTGALLWQVKLRKPPLWVAWIHIKICTLPLNNKVLGTQYFSATRQGYRQMLTWMASFGTLKRIGVECTGTYGSGLLRYFQNAGLEVLEVTAPDRMERRKRGKSDTIDAECTAHAAFSGIRTVTPKTRDGMIESLRVLKTCRKTAISARRVALQIIHSNIISAPDELREQLRNMTRMQLIRTPGTWRPDAREYRNVTNVYRIALKSLARRYIELHDEIAALDVMIAAIVDELAPELIKHNAIGYKSAS
ncbi:Transposase [Salmonella enterica]|nr:Transposase [Salmonella enterica]